MAERIFKFVIEVKADPAKMAGREARLERKIRSAISDTLRHSNRPLLEQIEHPPGRNPAANHFGGERLPIVEFTCFQGSKWGRRKGVNMGPTKPKENGGKLPRCRPTPLPAEPPMPGRDLVQAIARAEVLGALNALVDELESTAADDAPMIAGDLAELIYDVIDLKESEPCQVETR